VKGKEGKRKGVVHYRPNPNLNTTIGRGEKGEGRARGKKQNGKKKSKGKKKKGTILCHIFIYLLVITCFS